MARANVRIPIMFPVMKRGLSGGHSGIVRTVKISSEVFLRWELNRGYTIDIGMIRCAVD
jgi:hypothetical protein